MTPGKYHAAVNDTEQLLKSCELFLERNYWPKYSGLDAAMMRAMDYEEQWRECLKNRWYDYLLNDQSFIQFRLQPYPSFSYYDCPLEAVSFEDFSIQQVGEGWEMYMEHLREEYDAYLETLVDRKSVTPLRYDYDVNSYKPGFHPAAHIHFGFGCNIRIATTKELNPVSFVLFVIRQHYPRAWVDFLDSGGINNFRREIRDNLRSVPGQYWNAYDSHELRLE